MRSADYGDAPERFIVRNSGSSFAAVDISVDDNAKVVTLFESSIINAPIAGRDRKYLSDITDPDNPSSLMRIPFYVRRRSLLMLIHGSSRDSHRAQRCNADQKHPLKLVHEINWTS